ncbi:hypothetical protein TNCV_1070471 [Trichonephila clavipes]|nr:hypothetical protein TNCV_1070471 [Trichonephila clavipes]
MMYINSAYDQSSLIGVWGSFESRLVSLDRGSKLLDATPIAVELRKYLLKSPEVDKGLKNVVSLANCTEMPEHSWTPCKDYISYVPLPVV